MSYDTTKLALQIAYPSNNLILDDRGMPSIYVRYPVETLNNLISEGDGSVHPAFRVNGIDIQEIQIGKFPGLRHDDRIYSLPGVVATTSITMEQYISACRNKGKGHHAITAAEWAYLALRSKKNKTQPKGNNQWGKDSTESLYTALRGNLDLWTNEGAHKTQTAQVLTGTGPDTWFDDGTKGGTWGLNGNIWEWTPGLRLVHGEVQVIPYNNAADAACDLSASSVAWQAINADATAWDNLFMKPNGSGTTEKSVKMDYIESKWKYTTSELTSVEDSSRMCAFKDVSCGEDIKEFAKKFLIAMALCPEDKDTDYTGNVWANNSADERCAFRGARWDAGAHAGVFALALADPRSNSWVYYGGRPAFVETAD